MNIHLSVLDKYCQTFDPKVIYGPCDMFHGAVVLPYSIKGKGYLSLMIGLRSELDIIVDKAKCR